MEETKPLSDLKHPAWNPRKISTFDFDNLVQSIKDLGDLSGVVRNVASGHIVGGNQRVEAYKKLGSDRIVITQQFDQMTRTGTTAHGYVVLPDGEQFSYRECYWPLDSTDVNGQQFSSKERVANVVANRAQGEWNNDLLAQVTFDLSQLENGDDLLKLTGQSEKEIEKLLKSVGVGDDPEPPADDQPDEKNEKLSFALSPDQREVVELALAQAKQLNAIPHTDLDNINGTALYYICKSYAETHTSQNNVAEQEIYLPPQTIQPPIQPTNFLPSDVPAAPDLTSIPADAAA